MTAHLAMPMDLDGVSQPARPGSIHVCALVRFKEEEGWKALHQFNRKGVESGLFPRWGIRVQHLARVVKSVAAPGELDAPIPQALVHFAIEEPSRMPGYLADPEYISLASLRDQALESYHFFQGS